MNQGDFLKILSQDGFPEPVLVIQERIVFIYKNTHPFEVIALVTHCQIDIVIDGIKSTYAAGDMFHLQHSQEHVECYGDNGVQYLASRKV